MKLTAYEMRSGPTSVDKEHYREEVEVDVDDSDIPDDVTEEVLQATLTKLNHEAWHKALRECEPVPKPVYPNMTRLVFNVDKEMRMASLQVRFDFIHHDHTKGVSVENFHQKL